MVCAGGVELIVEALPQVKQLLAGEQVVKTYRCLHVLEVGCNPVELPHKFF